MPVIGMARSCGKRLACSETTVGGGGKGEGDEKRVETADALVSALGCGGSEDVSDVLAWIAVGVLALSWSGILLLVLVIASAEVAGRGTE